MKKIAVNSVLSSIEDWAEGITKISWVIEDNDLRFATIQYGVCVALRRIRDIEVYKDRICVYLANNSVIILYNDYIYVKP